MVRAAYRCEVAWNGIADASWMANDDVTARVRAKPGVAGERGKDQLRVLAPPMAGTLKLTLDNASQDYSPENGASPLAGLLVPGRRTQVWASTSRDDFDRADSAVTLGAADVGSAWSVKVGTWGISGNRAYSVTDASGDLCAVETSQADGEILCTVRGTLLSASNYRVPGIVFRYADANNHLWVQLHVDGFHFWKRDGGVNSELSWGALSLADGTDYVMRVRLDGNVVTFMIDSASWRVPYTLAGGDTKYAAYTQHGLRLGKGGSPGVAARFDDWRFYRPLLHGRLSELLQRPERGTRAAGLSCVGNLSRLAGHKVSTSLWTNIRTDQALGYLLDGLLLGGPPWPVVRVFDVGQTVLARWWLDEVDALDAAVALLNAEGPGAALYEDGQGRLHFESRHYRSLTARCTSVQGTFRDSGSEPLHGKPFRYESGMNSIVNECTVKSRTLSLQALSVIWQLGETAYLGPNESKRYVVRSTSGDPFTAAVSPLVAGVDYSVAAGAIVNANLVDRTSGGNVTLALTAGPAGAVVGGLQVRAQLLTVGYTTLVRQTISTTSSEGAYGKRSYELDVWPVIDVGAAQNLANMVVSWYQQPRPTVLVSVNNGTMERLNQLLVREVSDRIHVVEAQTGVDDDVFVEYVQHEVRSGGARHVTTLGGERVAPAGVPGGYWVLGDAEASVLGTSTYLGF